MYYGEGRSHTVTGSHAFGLCTARGIHDKGPPPSKTKKNLWTQKQKFLNDKDAESFLGLQKRFSSCLQVCVSVWNCLPTCCDCCRVFSSPKPTACVSAISTENPTPGPSSSAVPRWLCRLLEPYQGIPSLKSSLYTSAHHQFDDSIVVKWQTKVPWSKLPDWPTKGSQPPDQTTAPAALRGSAGCTAGNFTDRALETPGSISPDISTGCQHMVATESTTALRHHLL